MGAKSLLNAHPKNVLGSKGARRCRVCGIVLLFITFRKLSIQYFGIRVENVKITTCVFF